MDERPYIPSDRWMTDEEAARLSEWFARSRRRDRIKGVVALLVGMAVVGLGVLNSPEVVPSRQDVDKSPKELIAQIQASDEEYAAAIQRLRISVQSKRQLEDLVALQSRYDQLRALTTGQEAIARAHRALLTERTMVERGFDFMLGVFASLVAALVWDHVGSRARRQRSDG